MHHLGRANKRGQDHVTLLSIWAETEPEEKLKDPNSRNVGPRDL